LQGLDPGKICKKMLESSDFWDAVQKFTVHIFRQKEDAERLRRRAIASNQ
jgi:hypothetical protein